MWDVINKLRRIIPPQYKFTAIVLVLMMALSAILELCMLGLLMPLVLAVSTPDWSSGQGLIAKFYRWCGSPQEQHFIVYLAVLLIVFAVLKAAFNYFMVWSQSLFVSRVIKLLTKNLVTNYVSAPYLFHVKTGMTELMNRVQNIRVLLYQVLQPLLFIFSEMFVVIALFLGICVIMPAIACLVMILGFLSLLAYLPVKKHLERLGEEQFIWSGRYNKALFQAFATIKEVKLSCDESCFINSVVDARWNLSCSEKKIYDMGQLPRLIIEMLAIILAMLILIFLICADTSLSHHHVCRCFHCRDVPDAAFLHENSVQPRQSPRGHFHPA